MIRTNHLIEVYVPQNPAQVVVLKRLLAEAGLSVVVVNDHIQGVAGEIPFACAMPRIWAQGSEAATARRICEAFDKRLVERVHGVVAHETPFCYHCGETVTSDARKCSACGSSL